MLISKIINFALTPFNLEVRFKKHNFLETILSQNGISEIFDVGANRGQYAVMCRKFGYAGKIFSFEPLASENIVLQRRARKDPLWYAIPQVALGSETGRSVINVAENSVSSSLLPITDSHIQIAEKSRYMNSEEVPIETLDYYFEIYHEDSELTLLKLDVQGYEKQVLLGARKCLSKIDLIQIEMSLSELYLNSETFSNMHAYLENEGFELVDIILGVRHPSNNSLAQFDGIYKKRISLT